MELDLFNIVNKKFLKPFRTNRRFIMKRILMIALAAGFAVQVPLFADGDVHWRIGVNLGTTVVVDDDDDDDYVYDDDDAHVTVWYEDCGRNGDYDDHMEYEWVIIDRAKVLRCRSVRFNLFLGTWVFGPWSLRFDVCHPGCQLHHVHHFYKPLYPKHRFSHMRFHDRLWRSGGSHRIYRYKGPCSGSRGHDHDGQYSWDHQMHDDHGNRSAGVRQSTALPKAMAQPEPQRQVRERSGDIRIEQGGRSEKSQSSVAAPQEKGIKVISKREKVR
jgi:hypothetical protein